MENRQAVWVYVILVRQVFFVSIVLQVVNTSMAGLVIVTTALKRSGWGQINKTNGLFHKCSIDWQ